MNYSNCRVVRLNSELFPVTSFEQEKYDEYTHRLFQMENVVFTPHVAAFSVDSSREVGYGSVANLVAVLSGRWPEANRIVNPHVQPRHPLTSV